MAIKHYLFLQRNGPADATAECFDLALTAAAFDQEIDLVFADDGVLWLMQGLPPILLDAIDRVSVENESLAARGLVDFALPPSMTRLSREALATLMAGAQIVVSA